MRLGEEPEGQLVRDYLDRIQHTPLFLLVMMMILLTIIIIMTNVINVVKVGKYCSTAESVKINNDKVVNDGILCVVP